MGHLLGLVRSFLPAPKRIEHAQKPRGHDASPGPSIFARAAKTAIPYALAIVICLGLLIWRMHLWNADLATPFVYGGDGLMLQMWIKGIIDYGWYLDNPNVGAPWGMDMRDFPMADALHFFVIKLMALAFPDAGKVFNLCFILTFPLTTVTGLFALRRLKLAYPFALMAALLFAFLPDHFSHVAHFFLASYYLLPLMVLILLDIHRGRLPYFNIDRESQADGENTPCLRCGLRACAAGSDCGGARSASKGCELRVKRWSLFSKRSLFTTAVCLLMGAAGVYYSYFACFFLLVVGLSCGYRLRSWAPAVAAAFAVLVISASVAITIVPSLVHATRAGNNASVAHRYPFETDLYGLRIAHLLMPVRWHAVPMLQNQAAGYAEAFAPVASTNVTFPLGAAASLGFLALLARLFLRPARPGDLVLADSLSLLTIAAILLGTIGGFGALFSFFVSPLIRCYGRLGVYIGFFALVMFAHLLQQMLAVINLRPLRGRILCWTVCCTATWLGVVDQTGSGSLPYATAKREYEMDRRFAQQIEHSLPDRGLVYQFPYLTYPEHGPIHKMDDYDPIRPYLHTHGTRWSYGVMAGRGGDAWNSELARQPLAEAVRTLSLTGFDGIYVDRFGYADSARKMETELGQLLGVAPIVNDDGRFSFFTMKSFNEELRAQFSESSWERLTNGARYPVMAYLGTEFTVGKDPGWCNGTGEIHFENYHDNPVVMSICMTCRGCDPKPRALRIKGLSLSEEIPIDSADRCLTTAVTVPPGKHVIRLRCESGRIFRISDFACHEAEDR
jgi:hypothetical protein